MRFPIPVSLDLPAHKVSLIIQAALSRAEIMWDKGDIGKHKAQYNNDVNGVFKHVHRLIRCIADCQISLGDSAALLNALLVQRSLHAKAWDDGALQMIQIKDIGPVAVRKLVNADIKCIQDLDEAEPHRIEMILKRNPPFGLELSGRLKVFPKLFVSAHVPPNTVSSTSGCLDQE